MAKELYDKLSQAIEKNKYKLFADIINNVSNHSDAEKGLNYKDNQSPAILIQLVRKLAQKGLTDKKRENLYKILKLFISDIRVDLNITRNSETALFIICENQDQEAAKILLQPEMKDKRAEKYQVAIQEQEDGAVWDNHDNVLNIEFLKKCGLYESLTQTTRKSHKRFHVHLKSKSSIDILMSKASSEEKDKVMQSDKKSSIDHQSIIASVEEDIKKLTDQVFGLSKKQEELDIPQNMHEDALGNSSKQIETVVPKKNEEVGEEDTRIPEEEKEGLKGSKNIETSIHEELVRKLLTASQELTKKKVEDQDQKRLEQTENIRRILRSREGPKDTFEEENNEKSSQTEISTPEEKEIETPFLLPRITTTPASNLSEEDRDKEEEKALPTDITVMPGITDPTAIVSSVKHSIEENDFSRSRSLDNKDKKSRKRAAHEEKELHEENKPNDKIKPQRKFYILSAISLDMAGLILAGLSIYAIFAFPAFVIMSISILAGASLATGAALTIFAAKNLHIEPVKNIVEEQILPDLIELQSISHETSRTSEIST